MVTDSEFILVNPDKSKLGCGIVKFIAFLQVQVVQLLYSLLLYIYMHMHMICKTCTYSGYSL